MSAGPSLARAGGPTSTAALLLTAALVGVASAVTVLLAAGGGPIRVPAGLPDAGPWVGWGLRAAHPVAQLLGVATVGTVLTGVVLLRGSTGDDGRPAGIRVVRAAGRWAAGWGVGSVLLAVVTVADTTGAPLTGVLAGLPGTVTVTAESRALLLSGAIAAVVALGARAAPAGPRRGVVLLVLALTALLPPALTGHAASAADPGTATSGVVVHVVAAALWAGGVVGIALHLRRTPAALAVAVPRFSALALVAVVTLAGSGLVTATSRLGTSLDAWTNGYGAVVVAKACVLVGLGVVGLVHRRRTMPALAAGRPGALVRLLSLEVVVMGAAMGLASALSRTPAPLPPDPGPVHGTGHETLPSAVAPVSLTELATAWRLDAIVILGLGLALGGYVVAVRRLDRHGDAWPRRRTAAFVAGLMTALVAMCSGVATYAPAMVSVQVAQLVLVLVPAPALLVLGRPLTLWARVGSPGSGDVAPAAVGSGVARTLSSPLTGAVLVSALLMALYRTPLIELSLRSSWVHLAVLVAALAVGTVLLWPVLGRDPVPEPRSLVERVTCLVGVAGVLAVLAAQLRYGDRLLAGPWFLELRWGWVDPVADQRLAGLVAALGAVGLLLLVAVCRVSPEGQGRGGLGARSAGNGGQTRSSTLPSNRSAGTAP
jgi:putative copper resistance protein D